MATQSFMTDLQGVNSNTSAAQQSSHATRSQSLASQPTQVQPTSSSSVQPVVPAATVQTEVHQVSESSLPLTKVLVPAQVAVVAHPFSEQSAQQQQSVLFQALTSPSAPHHFIAVATVPGQESDRQEVSVHSAQAVPCVQYVDEGGGPNLYSAPNGHMTTYSVYTTPETSAMYTPNSAAYYNASSNSENYSQLLRYLQSVRQSFQALFSLDNFLFAILLVQTIMALHNHSVGVTDGQTSASVESHSFTEQQDVFHAVDENGGTTDHETGQMSCYPSSRLSAATMKWLIDNYEMADGMSVPRSTMYSHYLKHCGENKMEPLNAASFGKLIRSVFAGLRTRRLGTRGNSKYHYYGIRLKPSSSINKAMDDIVSTTFRQNPFQHVRRVKSEHSVKMENSEQCDISKAYESNENEKKRYGPSQQPQQKQQHQIYLGDASTAIPSIEIDLSSCSLPGGLTLENVKLFKNLYREHCELFLEAVVNFQFNVVESLWQSFWNKPLDDQNQSDDPHLTKPLLLALCAWQPIQEFVKHTDYQFYQNLVDVLIPEVLRPIPSTLTQAIRNFAKSLEGWLKAAMSECCDDIVNIKVSAISAFAQTLRRYTSLNHLAQAARAVLQSTTQIKQMTADLSKVDFRNIQEQASWVCQCDDETVQRLLGEFRQTLQHHLWLEEWATWLENIVTLALKPYEGKPNYPKAARQFLLKWSFYSSLVIRDLTLRSAASFGSFHLLRLLYDEYMFYIIEHCIAKATGTTTIAVMGEYLCSGKPEELCGNFDHLKATEVHGIVNTNPKDILHQNGCTDADVLSSHKCVTKLPIVHN